MPACSGGKRLAVMASVLDAERVLARELRSLRTACLASDREDVA
jgi:hypothetical protein